MEFYRDFKRYGEKTALLGSDGTTIDYESLEDYGKMVEEHIGSRRLILQLCVNTPGSAAGYLSFLYSRNVPMLLDGSMDTGLLLELTERYRPQYLYIPERMEALFENTEPVIRKYGYVLLRRTEERGAAPLELYDELGLLLTTSGSTGSPKFVRLSYRNLNANAGSIRDYLKIDEKELPITTLPMHYTYGLSIINSHILAGAGVLMTEYTIFQREFWELLDREKATSFGGVPYTYEMLKKLRVFQMPLPSVTTMTQAGGKLPVTLHREYLDYAEKFGKKFVIMYGQTEATARMSYLPPEKSREKLGSIGIAIPGGRFELADLNGVFISDADVTGELVYYGPNVSLGYAETREDLRKGDERNGCLITGDMAKRDADGYYYIVGRKKRFLKLYGKRVNMDEVEQLVKKEFDAETAVAGTDDSMCVYVAGLRKPEEVLRIQEFLSEKLGIFQKAFHVKYLDEIPKNSSGKIQYQKLQENNL